MMQRGKMGNSLWMFHFPFMDSFRIRKNRVL